MSRKSSKKRAWRVGALQNQIIPALLSQVIAELQPCRPGADHQRINLRCHPIPFLNQNSPSPRVNPSSSKPGASIGCLIVMRPLCTAQFNTPGPTGAVSHLAKIHHPGSKLSQRSAVRPSIKARRFSSQSRRYTVSPHTSSGNTRHHLSTPTCATSTGEISLRIRQSDTTPICRTKGVAFCDDPQTQSMVCTARKTATYRLRKLRAPLFSQRRHRLGRVRQRLIQGNQERSELPAGVL